MSQLLTNIKTFVNKYFYKREEKPVKYKEWFSITYFNGDLYINEDTPSYEFRNVTIHTSTLTPIMVGLDLGALIFPFFNSETQTVKIINTQTDATIIGIPNTSIVNNYMNHSEATPIQVVQTIRNYGRLVLIENNEVLAYYDFSQS